MQNVEGKHGHLQVHNELKPSNRVVNIYLYSLSLTFKVNNDINTIGHSIAILSEII